MQSSILETKTLCQASHDGSPGGDRTRMTPIDEVGAENHFTGPQEEANPPYQEPYQSGDQGTFKKG